MKAKGIENFQGKKIEILEMNLMNKDNQLELLFRFCCKDKIYEITFYNVSRLKIDEFSSPLEIHGFEIINHSQDGWDIESRYEIRDFEDKCINFFCDDLRIQ